MWWEIISRYLLTHPHNKSPDSSGDFLLPMFRYFIIYKPYRVLSQFSPLPGKQTLADFFKLPADVYPVGRLDYDSEGLLLLTNDPGINHRLLNPVFSHQREYWVQVEGMAGHHQVQQLQAGVTIRVNGKPWLCKPVVVTVFNQTPDVPDREPPIRFRKNLPASWMRLIVTEGKTGRYVK